MVVVFEAVVVIVVAIFFALHIKIFFVLTVVRDTFVCVCVCVCVFVSVCVVSNL